MGSVSVVAEPGFTDVECSFCGRHNREAHMVGREDLRICSVCVARAASVLDHDADHDGPDVDWLGRWRLKDGTTPAAEG